MNAVIIAAGLIVAGVIHLLPLPGILGGQWLTRLYGLTVDNPDLLVMMRHRALLFGVIGAFMIAAAFRADWRLPALLVGFASALGFVLIARQTGAYSAPVARVVAADLVAVASLGVAAMGMWLR